MNDRIKARAGSPGNTMPPKSPAKQNAQDEAAKLKKLDSSRKALFDLLSKFRGYLADTTLPENKTATGKEVEAATILDISKTAWDLNFQNLDEGTMTIISLLLHSSLLSRDEINKLKFQNAYLARQVGTLKKQVQTLKSEDKTSDEHEK